MLWVLFGVLAFVFLLIGTCIDDNGLGAGAGLIFGALIYLPCLLPVPMGIGVYASLVGVRAELVSLKEEIETVRSAHYSEVSSGQLVGGSLDNIQQSKELSTYIKSYASKKAEYNSSLASAKVRKELKMYWLWADGMFISEKVQKLEKF